MCHLSTIASRAADPVLLNAFVSVTAAGQLWIPTRFPLGSHRQSRLENRRRCSLATVSNRTYGACGFTNFTIPSPRGRRRVGRRPCLSWSGEVCRAISYATSVSTPTRPCTPAPPADAFSPGPVSRPVSQRSPHFSRPTRRRLPRRVVAATCSRSASRRVTPYPVSYTHLTLPTNREV